MEQAFCNRCGAQLDGLPRCPRCGTPAHEPPPSTEPDSADRQQPPRPPWEQDPSVPQQPPPPAWAQDPSPPAWGQGPVVPQSPPPAWGQDPLGAQSPPPGWGGNCHSVPQQPSPSGWGQDSSAPQSPPGRGQDSSAPQSSPPEWGQGPSVPQQPSPSGWQQNPADWQQHSQAMRPESPAGHQLPSHDAADRQPPRHGPSDWQQPTRKPTQQRQPTQQTWEQAPPQPARQEPQPGNWAPPPQPEWEKGERPEKGRRTWLVVASVLAVMIAAGIAWFVARDDGSNLVTGVETAATSGRSPRPDRLRRPKTLRRAPLPRASSRLSGRPRCWTPCLPTAEAPDRVSAPPSTSSVRAPTRPRPSRRFAGSPTPAASRWFRSRR